MTPSQIRANQKLCKHIFPNDHNVPSWRWVECSECGIEMGEVVSQEEWERVKKA